MIASKPQDRLNTPAESLDDLYFEFQSDIGMTKHIGSTKATDELLTLCHINENSTVLDVGCGVGFTSRYIAEKFKSRVVGVDIRPHMVDRATQYAREAQLGDYVRYEVADACRLPMSDNVYDAVICESVLAFIPDQNQVLREWVRVTKPGGFIGFTEAIWFTPPPEDARLQMDQVTGRGSGVQPSANWVALLRQAGLENLQWQQYRLNIVNDAMGQIKKIGGLRLLGMWGKTAKLMLTNPHYRSFMRDANTIPKSLMKHIGYGVYVGQVPKS